MSDTPTLRAVAEAIADYLFVNVNGDQADRLVLTIDSPKCDLGGWCKEAVVEVLLRHLAPVVGVKWQPIESAPKDGTKILAFREDAGVFMAHYVPSLAAEDTHESGRTGDPCWFTFDGGDDLTNDTPTHWMPLPCPPAGGAA